MPFGNATNNNIFGPGSFTDATDPFGLGGLGSPVFGMGLETGAVGGLLNQSISNLPGAPETVLDVQTHDNNYNWNQPTNTQYVIDPTTGVQSNQTFNEWAANGNINPVGEDHHLRYANPSSHKKAMGWTGVNTAPTKNPGDPYFMKTIAERDSAKALAAAPLAAPNSGAFKNVDYNWNGAPSAPVAAAPQPDIFGNVFNPSMNQGGRGGMFGFGIVGAEPPTWDHDSSFDAPTGGSSFGGSTGGWDGNATFSGADSMFSGGGDSGGGAFGTAEGLGGESNSLSDDMADSSDYGF